MGVHISEHFTYKKLFRAVLPSIFMMIFTSIYNIVDGIFVSNFIGTTAYASVNLVMPVIMIIGAVGFMLGTGGNALVAKTLGEGDKEKANRIFSMVVYFTILVGFVLCAIVFIFMEQIAIWLGATEEMLSNCVVYGRILIAFDFMFMLQNLFQSMFIVAEKAMLGFFVIVAAGVTNMVLDALFILVFDLGIVGTAVATAMSFFVGGCLPLIYFANKKNSSLLRLVKTKFDFKAIGFSCLNGSSELVTNISLSIVSIIFNLQLLNHIGENGVVAYGVIMCSGFVFAAIFLGYSIGVAPIIGYNLGSKNTAELKNILKKSLIIIVILGILMFGFAELFPSPLTHIFVRDNSEIIDITTYGMRLYGISFLIFGINIFSSAFFTALNNGLISALISFLRFLVFQVGAILILPMFLGIEGIWLAVVVAEILALIVSISCFILNKKKYNY